MLLYYIVETKSKVKGRWDENDNQNKISKKPSKHIRKSVDHYFAWTIFSNAPKNVKTRKNLKASHIALWKPNVNVYKDSERLALLVIDVTKRS